MAVAVPDVVAHYLLRRSAPFVGELTAFFEGSEASHSVFVPAHSDRALMHMLAEIGGCYSTSSLDVSRQFHNRGTFRCRKHVFATAPFECARAGCGHGGGFKNSDYYNTNNVVTVHRNAAALSPEQTTRMNRGRRFYREHTRALRSFIDHLRD